MKNDMFDLSEKGNMVFSWAENENGEMVHVDSVPNGLGCNCHCPACNETVLARHGEKNSHGFAHKSEIRQAKLDICYKVVLYKVAEQLIKDRKTIYLPSYYSIFKAQEVTFVNVEVNSDYEREDKQPDIIATTADKQQYIIELYFDEKAAGHAREIDYSMMNCIEINLTGQTLDSIDSFITGMPDGNWKWVNNNYCFNRIVDKYKDENLRISVVLKEECANCKLKYLCNDKGCCAKYKESDEAVEIRNNGQLYKICKVKQKEELLAHIDRNKKTQTDSNDKLSGKYLPQNCLSCKYGYGKLNRKGEMFCIKDYTNHVLNHENDCKRYVCSVR